MSFKDMTGEKFGELTVINTKMSVPTTGKKRKLCVCLCKCGKIITRRSDYLLSGKCTHCGCGTERFENIIGQKYERLTVIDLKIDTFATEKRYKRIWICKCDCGNILEVRRPDSLKCGDIKSCGCYSKETIKKAIKSNTLPKGEASFNSLYSRYRQEAPRRNLCFELTKKQFKILTSSNCYYCGKIPEQICNGSNNGVYLYNGIDRADNNIGYSFKNCLPCCKDCNFIKGSLDKDEFLEQIKLIYKYKNNNISSFCVTDTGFNNTIALNVLLHEYKKNARVKGLDFTINKNDFKHITKSNCYYCGSPPKNIRYNPNKKWKYTFNGIDRINNSIGYTKNNCRPCCKKCNYMKREYDETHFLLQVEKIYRNKF